MLAVQTIVSPPAALAGTLIEVIQFYPNLCLGQFSDHQD